MNKDKLSSVKFSKEQKELLQELLPSLDREQLLLVSAFVGSVALSDNIGGASIAPKVKDIPLTIIFGTESGNAEGLAVDAQKQAKKLGFKVQLIDMFDAKLNDLQAENLIIFVSTWGEGDAPERSERFYKEFQSDSSIKLSSDNKFAVCALGDSSYVDFCEVGKVFDKKLEDIGGKRLFSRIDLDVDYKIAANEWIDNALAAFITQNSPLDIGSKDTDKAAQVISASVSKIDYAPLFGRAEYSAEEPFTAELIEKIKLNEILSKKETYHYAFDLGDSGMEYKAGDALGILPQNDKELVSKLIDIAKLDASYSKDGKNINQLLTEEIDITTISKPVLESYAAISGNEKIITDIIDSNKIAEYSYGRDLLDLVTEYPAKNKLDTVAFLATLRKLPARLYSIASAQDFVGDEVHLTIGTVRYNSQNRNKKGVATGFLADNTKIGDKVKIYVKENKYFRLPEDTSRPIIMVGPGTGIAPFRGFVQQRVHDNASGKNWLFFGEQNFLYDFYYQTEWLEHVKNGKLHNFDVAFSRDTPSKVYVQHKMQERSKELFNWLQEGAYFYICGDEKRMAKDVDAMLHKIVADNSGKQSTAATDFAVEYIAKMKQEQRYLKDVY